MSTVADHPLMLFVSSFLILWVSTWVGVLFCGNTQLREKGLREDFGVVQAATLTLLGLIIGFSFSMAAGRYDQRKDYEGAEANAIGTEYVRADLLRAPEVATKLRALLLDYLTQRILFYSTRNDEEVPQINERTARLQSELWATILPVAAAHPTPVVGLAVSGMNDVLNTEADAQASWWNRIPTAAWVLMVVIAIVGTFLVGYGTHSARTTRLLLQVLPWVLSIAFLLIADIDSPRHGVIHVGSPDLENLATTLRAR